MPFSMFVSYPNTPGAKFNVEYYSTTHFGIVEKLWRTEGLESWNVVSFIGDEKAPYMVIAETVWRDGAAAATAFSPGPALAEVMADVPNFTELAPVTFAGEQVAKSKY